jgi:anti-sigma regulatory factor (Ser/Thr protein kinase)
MDYLNFKVSSELKSILGRDLIVNDYIAILELVKNSYDAYATLVEIRFEDDKIVISDNGKGMSLTDIKEKWLFVGFSAKRDGTEDVKRASFRNNINRNYAGAKGIGRLSCDRLSRVLTMTTKSVDSLVAEQLNVKWSLFDEDQRQEMETISIPHESLLDENVKFAGGSAHGTTLVLSNLYEEWDREKILNLRKFLEKMINPFQSSSDEFHIMVNAEREQEEDSRIEEYLRVNGEIRNSISAILDIKTTKIDSEIRNGVIHTRLEDRGILMYEIEEDCKYEHLNHATVSMYYLNRAAKYNFSLRMGMQPVNYGSIFLFRNGIRVLPYGEPNDDSWNLDKRLQQGYNRFLGTRELFGRVDVETENIEDFKEVSSRDGGLINTPSAKELSDYFNSIHRRLERYVAGVLWGDNFLQKEYFQNVEDAKAVKEQLKEQERDSTSAIHLYTNIGSKVDFMQLIKSLVNEKDVRVISYNKELADIVADVDSTDLIKIGLINDLERIVAASNDKYQQEELDKLRASLNELNERRKETERALRAQQEKNRYLSAVRNTSKEVEDMLHVIAIASDGLDKILKVLIPTIRNGEGSNSYVLERLNRMKLYSDRITQLTKLITKADIKDLRQSTIANIVSYTMEYLKKFNGSMYITFDNQIRTTILKKLSLLDLSVVLDNLISNSSKAEAKQIHVTFRNEDTRIIIDFSDDGTGVDMEMYNPEDLFEEGVTNRSGGSGIGLSTIKRTMKKQLKGDVIFLGNGKYNLKGATFELIFN